MNFFKQLPKTCVIGASGFIGEALWKKYRTFDPDAIGTSHKSNSALPFVDLLHPNLEPLGLKNYKYGVISAAVPNILLCEKEPQKSYQVNVSGTLEIAAQLLRLGITPILFSTDYIFNGEKGSYNETSPLHPLNTYGKQKALLEEKLQEQFPDQYLLIRLSKVYGLQRGDGTLIDQMFEALLKQQKIRAAFDQIFSPIAIEDVVHLVLALQHEEARGIYHICGSEAISRLDLAYRVCKALDGDAELIEPISLDDLQEPFLRPKRTDMLNQKVLQTTKAQIQPLDLSIHYLAEQYLQKVVS